MWTYQGMKFEDHGPGKWSSLRPQRHTCTRQPAVNVQRLVEWAKTTGDDPGQHSFCCRYGIHKYVEIGEVSFSSNLKKVKGPPILFTANEVHNLIIFVRYVVRTLYLHVTVGRANLFQLGLSR